MIAAPVPSVIYARAALIERLAHVYGCQGRDRLYELGVEIAEGIEKIADSVAMRREA